MWIRWLGAALVFLGGGGFGLSMAHGQRREEQQLESLVQVLSYMENELACNLTALPLLCELSAQQVKGELHTLFSELAQALQSHAASDAHSCMEAVLDASASLPESIREPLSYLGKSMGRFDLHGQLSGLHATGQMCTRRLDALRTDRRTRWRSYRVLGLCAGAALAILLL